MNYRILRSDSKHEENLKDKLGWSYWTDERLPDTTEKSGLEILSTDTGVLW